VSQPEEAVRIRGGSHRAQAQAPVATTSEGLDVYALLSRVARNRVRVAAILLIAASLVWKAAFLSHLFFVYDDFYNQELAIGSPLSWRYLSFEGLGHFMVGPRALMWLMARASLYGWALASAVTLAFVAAASLAALRLLRTLFGDRPAILVPLLFYLLSPLTLPDIGWWSSALESVPLQLAILMALDAHVRYIRQGRIQQLAAAVAWLAFGLAFFEKALVLPVLLFAVTSAYLVGAPSWLVGARLALRRYWRAWLAYLAIEAGYAVLFLQSLQSSVVKPQAPPSAGAVLTFAWGLVKDTFLPGALGGPWRWLPLTGFPSVAVTPSVLTWVAVIVALIVFLFGVMRVKSSWRAWAILAMWVVLADMVPVFIGRLGFSPALRALDTHFVADAMPVLAVCIGLAFLPLESDERAAADVPTGQGTPYRAALDQAWQMFATALVGAFVFGAIWSAATYEGSDNLSQNATYIANAKTAVALAPRGTNVADWTVSSNVMSPLFGKYAYASTLIGDVARGTLSGKLRWRGVRPSGTIDRLTLFGPDGRLYPAQVVGVLSAKLPFQHKCWAERGGQIVIRFAAPTSLYGWELRIGYYWYPSVPGQVTVRYGTITRILTVLPGLHDAYLPVAGSVRTVVVEGLGAARMCVGDAKAGVLQPNLAGLAIPASSAGP
jgi:hypothetical protein